jgi:hypothetical protein
MRRRILVLFLGLLPLLHGCNLRGRGEAEKVHSSVVPVSGKLLFADGRPVINAWVVFHPKDPPGNEANAATDPDGTFRLGTFGKDDGAVPGRYVVTIERHPNARTGVAIPRSYSSATTSPLAIEVKKDGLNDLGNIYLK